MGSRRRPRSIAIVRIVGFALVVTCVIALGLFWRNMQNELETAKAALLDEVDRVSKKVAPDGWKLVKRVEALLATASARYRGDTAGAALRVPGALDEWLQRPAVYVRGSIDGFRSTRSLETEASSSAKDALLFCLLDPPSALDEKTLMSKVLSAKTGDEKMRAATANVQRLHDAIVGLPLLRPDFAKRVENARSMLTLDVLHRQFDNAPTEEAAAASAAETLIYVFDEPKKSGSVTELDGANVHPMQLGIVEIDSGMTILRVRHTVDPSWVSVPRRPQHSRALNGCRFASEARRFASGDADADAGSSGFESDAMAPLRR